MFLKKLMIALLAIVLMAGAGLLIQSCNDNPTESTGALAYTDDGTGMAPPEEVIKKAVDILARNDCSGEEKEFLESLSRADWSEVVAYIKSEEIVLYPDDSFVVKNNYAGSDLLSSCSWTGTTRWNEGLTKALDYRYCGSDGCHYAVYFTVDANASCYSKNADWWVYTWTPTHGDVHDWYLLLYRDRYWNGYKYVKDVALLIPTIWWSIYYPHWPASFKAARFYVSWNSYNNGCCE